MPDDEGLREEMAEALLVQTMLAGAQVRAVLDALLPVVERYGRHCATEALRGRTDGVRRWASICNPGPFRDGLAAAADALDGRDA